jgi:hypothetical protein
MNCGMPVHLKTGALPVIASTLPVFDASWDGVSVKAIVRLKACVSFQKKASWILRVPTMTMLTPPAPPGTNDTPVTVPYWGTNAPAV